MLIVDVHLPLLHHPSITHDVIQGMQNIRIKFKRAVSIRRQSSCQLLSLIASFEPLDSTVQMITVISMFITCST